MDFIPVVEHPEQEYIICDRNLMVVQFSDDVPNYTDQEILIGEDIRNSFPEIVGLEETCQEILSGQQEYFRLDTVSRHQESDQILYFNLSITAQSEHLIILLTDVTASTLLQQASIQRINEVEIVLNKLQRFEYCTNKIIASMQDVLLITSPQGKIERINKSCTELFKQKKSELINQPIDCLIQDPHFNHQNIYNSLLNSDDTVRKVEVNFLGKAEQTIQIEFDCFIAPTEVKNFFNCVYIGRDITARKQAEAEIRKSLAREKELRELKSGFISMASHEFRNPLSSILLCVQNLRENPDFSESSREFYLQSIQDAALTMNSLLEDVLVLSKAESDRRQLKLEPVNLQEFCLKIIDKLTSIYDDKKVEFDYQSELKIINLDLATLRNILNNLISNALKYSPSGSTVNLAIFHLKQPDRVKIEVRDRGIGIPLESQKHLFESFYRASNVNSIPGTGLGLAIVKKSVDLYQGSVVVKSKVNQGTTIEVMLPIK
ncbi:MAG: PAS domain-containing sensor histidine kinase [Cyanobacteria bacterium P01_G01_bin.39]